MFRLFCDRLYFFQLNVDWSMRNRRWWIVVGLGSVLLAMALLSIDQAPWVKVNFDLDRQAWLGWGRTYCRNVTAPSCVTLDFDSTVDPLTCRWSRVIWRISSLSCIVMIVVAAITLKRQQTVEFVNETARLAALSVCVLSPTAFCLAALLLWMSCESHWIANATADQWPVTASVAFQHTGAGLGVGLVTFLCLGLLAFFWTLFLQETVQGVFKRPLHLPFLANPSCCAA